MNLDDLNIEVKEKWRTFYQAATAAGVWFLCFAGSIALAKWLEVGPLTMTMLALSFVFYFVTLVRMVGAALDAKNTSQQFDTELKVQSPVKPRV